MDLLDVGQPIASLAWSLSYDKLSIGTTNGDILLADPMNLEEGGTVLVSDHHSSSVIGLDMLGPGSQYCVVSVHIACRLVTHTCKPTVSLLSLMGQPLKLYTLWALENCFVCQLVHNFNCCCHHSEL